MLKADFHIHTREDKQNAHILYSDEELIDLAAKEGFSVLSFTFHNQFHHPKKIIAYAKRKGILLIPGIEKTIGNNHVLLINYPLGDEKKIANIRTFNDFRKYLNSLRLDKRDSLLTVFAHPRYWLVGMTRTTFRKNIDLCDALEFQSFWHKAYNFNEDVQRLSEKYHKPLVGNTDAHILEQFGSTYTLIDAKRRPEAIINTIKKGKCTVVTTPLPAKTVLKRIQLEFT